MNCKTKEYLFCMTKRQIYHASHAFQLMSIARWPALYLHVWKKTGIFDSFKMYTTFRFWSYSWVDINVTTTSSFASTQKTQNFKPLSEILLRHTGRICLNNEARKLLTLKFLTGGKPRNLFDILGIVQINISSQCVKNRNCSLPAIWTEHPCVHPFLLVQADINLSMLSFQNSIRFPLFSFDLISAYFVLPKLLPEQLQNYSIEYQWKEYAPHFVGKYFFSVVDGEHIISWATAAEVCKTKNATLPLIHNQQLADDLMQYIFSNTRHDFLLVNNSVAAVVFIPIGLEYLVRFCQ